MPTKKPRVTFTMDENQLAKIDEYRFKNKLKNQTQAILSLIEYGFDNLNSLESEQNFSKEQITLIEKYSGLDEYGKEIVDFILDKEYERAMDDYVEFAARGGKYKVKREVAEKWAKEVVSDSCERNDDLC